MVCKKNFNVKHLLSRFCHPGQKPRDFCPGSLVPVPKPGSKTGTKRGLATGTTSHLCSSDIIATNLVVSIHAFAAILNDAIIVITSNNMLMRQYFLLLTIFRCSNYCCHHTCFMAIYSIATKSFLSRYDQSQPNICVAIHPLATTLAVAKKSIGTHVCPLQLYTMAMVYLCSNT